RRSPPRRHRRPRRNQALSGTGCRIAGDTHHAQAAGAVRHRVHPNATPRSRHGPGGPQRRGSPPALRMIFESKTTEQVADTGYGLVQAAGEYLDHVRTARSWETRLNRTLIRPEPLKHRALSLVREVISAD